MTLLHVNLYCLINAVTLGQESLQNETHNVFNIKSICIWLPNQIHNNDHFPSRTCTILWPDGNDLSVFSAQSDHKYTLDIYILFSSKLIF